MTYRRVSEYCCQASDSPGTGAGANLCGDKLYEALRMQTQEHCRHVLMVRTATIMMIIGAVVDRYSDIASRHI